jgi:hypothetical protein
MNDTTFDPERLRLLPEEATELTKAKSKHSKRRKRTEPFLQIPHKALVAGGKAGAGGKQLLVWLYIHHRVWADKRNTVTIGNQTLSSWGVSRRVKYAALRKLEAAERPPSCDILTAPQSRAGHSFKRDGSNGAFVRWR